MNNKHNEQMGHKTGEHPIASKLIFRFETICRVKNSLLEAKSIIFLIVEVILSFF